ncbi:MAG: HindIII family type II restriction endonuclease [Elusimicrobiota bacterium]|nr:HindIII family type II restriction endonuclease [Elusimicrobiota bacterium]
MFDKVKELIKRKSKERNFILASESIEKYIFALKKKQFIPLITKIGVISEDIAHDSSEEKLYSKAADIVLAKCFQFLGLKSEVMRERSNCADVYAKSVFHNYSLVADAKAFRLSRTAKNQKDFKVGALSIWRKDNDYAVLTAPYYQYPKMSSQIFGQALNSNVALLSWELFSIMIQNDISENVGFNLEFLWNISSTIAKDTSIENQNNSFTPSQNKLFCLLIKMEAADFNRFLGRFKIKIINRAEEEISFWRQKIEEIKHYSKEKAIQELLISLKLKEKIKVIEDYIYTLRKND